MDFRYIAVTAFALLIVLVLIRAAILRRQGIKVIIFGETDKSDFLLILPILFFVYALIGLPLPELLKHRALDSELLGWCGVALCAAALVWFAVTLRHFGSSFRVGIDENTKEKLITGGTFSLSRNPLYIGFDVFFIGQLLIAPNLASLIVVLFFGAVIHRQILREEKFLRAHYGQEYADYCGKVRRYL
ncbi:MAG: isoprenylcysteine carboxylmethyltransferase family protein [Firmicutes bacterium]|nr:isoprenylcysteine carboxylmethyltransferase family protein [Bacillota bacterium]